MSSRSESKKVACMALAGLALLLAGCLLDRWMPINKSLWTSTFSIFMAGLALVCLAFFHWLIDVAGYSKWAMPLIIPGLNPITLYVGSPKWSDTSLRSVNMVTIKGKRYKLPTLHVQDLLRPGCGSKNRFFALRIRDRLLV